MSFVITILKLKDYATWKSAYDERAALRKANGSKESIVMRNADDPNQVVVLIEWDLEKAKNYVKSGDLKDYLTEAGIIGQPEFFYLEEIERTK